MGSLETAIASQPVTETTAMQLQPQPILAHGDVNGGGAAVGLCLLLGLGTLVATGVAVYEGIKPPLQRAFKKLGEYIRNNDFGSYD